MTRSLVVLLVLSGITVVSACTSVREIETSPPQPRSEASDDASAAQEASFSIIMTSGETALPGDVTHLRFRISEVRLRQTDGRWIRLPSDAAPIEITGSAATWRRTLLDTRVAPVEYDSITVAFADVFVRFGPNAGAPLATARDAPHRLSLAVEPARDARTSVLLTMEVGASLSRAPDCRWFFVPMLLAEVTTGPVPPVEAGGR